MTRVPIKEILDDFEIACSRFMEERYKKCHSSHEAMMNGDKIMWYKNKLEKEKEIAISRINQYIIRKPKMKAPRYKRLFGLYFFTNNTDD